MSSQHSSVYHCVSLCHSGGIPSFSSTRSLICSTCLWVQCQSQSPFCSVFTLISIFLSVWGCTQINCCFYRCGPRCLSQSQFLIVKHFWNSCNKRTLLVTFSHKTLCDSNHQIDFIQSKFKNKLFEIHISTAKDEKECIYDTGSKQLVSFKCQVY